MKLTIAIFLMLCLQVAMSPLCLCLGANASQETARPACCHAPADEEPAHCPHCDQEMPISATAPVKGDFSTEPPEWHGFDLHPRVDLFDTLRTSVSESPEYGEIQEFEPPPLSFREAYGVFLI